MAVIDSRGLVDDGSNSLTVAGSVAVTGASTKAYSVLTSATLTSGSTVLTAPGMFRYNGGLVTLPSAASFPGSTCVFAPTAASSSSGLTGGGLILTGSAVIGTVVFAAQSSGSIDGTNTTFAGQKLTVATSGSVVLMSDGNYWLVASHRLGLTFA